MEKRKSKGYADINQVRRFSIRKFHFGAASIVVGIFLAGGVLSDNAAQAADNKATETQASTTITVPNTIADATTNVKDGNVKEKTSSNDEALKAKKLEESKKVAKEAVTKLAISKNIEIEKVNAEDAAKSKAKSEVVSLVKNFDEAVEKATDEKTITDLKENIEKSFKSLVVEAKSEEAKVEEKTEAKAEEKTEAKAEEKTEAKAEEKTEAKAEEKTEATNENIESAVAEAQAMQGIVKNTISSGVTATGEKLTAVVKEELTSSVEKLKNVIEKGFEATTPWHSHFSR